MTNLRVDQFREFTDTLRLQGGAALTVRFVEPDDSEALQDYFRKLSSESRYLRFLGATNELPPAELARTLHSGEDNRFSVIAELMVEGRSRIIGEMRYAFDLTTRTCEFGLSVADPWQTQGIGSALLSNLACRAAALGAARLVGDTLRSNAPMLALARKAGFAFTNSPGDWRLVRFVKTIAFAPQEIPCESWKRAATLIGSRLYQSDTLPANAGLA